MSSLAGALDPVDQGLKEEPPLDDIDMPAEGVLADDDASDDPKVQDEEMQDLFGEADDNVEEVKHNETAAVTPASSEPAEQMDGISSSERRHREAMEYAEEEDEEQPPEQILLEATAAIPNIPVPRSSDGNYWVIRMPNFVKVDSKPFHPDTYIGPEGEDEDAQAAESAREKSMTIKLKVENTVRWRWVKDENGQDRRQSNARIVRWSDGTLSLLLGKELFDITQTIDTSGAIPRQAFGPGTQNQSLSQSQSQGTAGPSKSQGLTYLVAQHKRAEILQSEALVTGYMSLRPTGMQSSTHRMLVRAVGQKHTKVARLRMAPDPVMDPEREKLEMMKAASRKPRRPRGEGDDGFGGRKRRSGYTRRKTGDEMWSDEDEDEAVYGGGSEDEYGEEPSSARKRRKGEKEDGKKGPGEYQTDDFVVADSDEDADAYGSDDAAVSKKRTKRHREEREPAEEDNLERMEKQIEEEERRRRRDGGPVGADADKEASMDVESEEEDEDGAVRRRTAGGSRKKRVIEMEEEEEE